MEDEITNALIEKTFLGFERGLLTCWLYLRLDECSQQGFGGYNILGVSPIKEILITVGVENWEALPGKYIRVKKDRDRPLGRIKAIGHITDNKWFIPGGK